MRGSSLFVACWLVASPLLAETYTVNTNGSASDGCDESVTMDPLVCDTGACGSPTGLCSINAAITTANDRPGDDEILFSVTTITLDADPPPITDPVELGPLAEPRVDINGADLFGGFTFDENAAGSTIRNLVIRNMDGNGIELSTGNGANLVSNCYIGTNTAGTAENGNDGDGISITSPAGPLPPLGATVIDDNVISGNAGDGIDISGENTTLVTVTRNFIGVDRNGLVAVPNGTGSGDHHGIRISVDAFGNIIGGVPPGLSNVIAGNEGINSRGISVSGDVDLPNVILGNFIGLTPALILDLGNGNAGIEASDVEPSDDNPTEVALLIGPTNVIGYNGSTDDPAPGIRISGTSRGVYVFLNAVGVAEDPGGFIDLGNSGDGIEVTSGPAWIGVDDLGVVGGNFIGNNGESGVEIRSAAANDITVVANVIGDPAPDDLFPMGNDGDGIKISFGGNNTIGGPGTDRNIIRGNGGNGIRVETGGAVANLITRNEIDENGLLGIDLDHFDTDGVVDPRDNLDPQPGTGNNGQNAPTLVAATYDGGSGQTAIQWELQSIPSTAGFVLEFFASPAADPSGSGEAAMYLGEVTGITTDATGFASGTAPVTPPSPMSTTGMVVAATARATYQVADLPGPSGPGPANDVSELSNTTLVKSFSIADASVVEGNAGPTALDVTVTRSDSGGTASVLVTTANGTAIAGSDYVALVGQQVDFADGQLVRVVTVTVNGDTTFEPDETLTLSLSGPSAGWGIEDGNATAVIQNDDPRPSASISDVAALEGNAGITPFMFTVTFSNPHADPVSLDFATTPGTAATPEDFATAAGSVVFPAESTSQIITIDVMGDTTPEPDENFFVEISTFAPAATVNIADGTGQGTIQNDDATLTFSINDVALAEGNAGTTGFTFTVSRTNTTDAASVSWETTAGSATAPADFAAVAATNLAFAPGQATRQVTVLVVGETMFEPNETFMVVLSNPSPGWSIGDGQGTGAIQNDDSLPAISISDVAALEGNAGTIGFSFTVSLSNPSATPVSVTATTADDSAIAPGDYAVTGPQVLTFAPGVVSQPFVVQVVGETAVELDETFFVNLTSPSGGSVADPQATGTIQNDDGVSAFSVGDLSQAEGNAGTTAFFFTVSRTSGTGTASVVWETAPGTASAPADFAAESPTLLSFAAGEVNRQVMVSVVGETVFEGDETFQVVLTNPSAGWTILDGSGLGTIVNDDGLPSLAIGDLAALEGDAGSTPFGFTVTLSNPSSQPVTVTAATANGSAVAPGDYTAAGPQLLSFAPGIISQPFTVQVAGDVAVEANESFVVNLSAASGASMPDSQATGTIQNDDGVLEFSLGDVTLAEGNVGTTAFVFTVSRTDSAAAASVSWSTAPGSAFAGSDYTTVPSTLLNFAPGQATRQVTVLVNGDTLHEADETFLVNLSGPSAGWSIGDGQGLGTIQNDDAAPGLSIGDLALFEGTGGTTPFGFAVTLSTASGLAVNGSYSTTDGGAVAPGDYAAATLAAFTIPAGSTSTDVVIQVVADAAVEPNESFGVSLALVSGAQVTDGQAQGTILDDDGTPQFAIDDVAQAEGSGGTTPFVFTVSRTTGTGTATVDVSTGNGSAQAPGDFAAATLQTVSFAAGQTTRPVTVQVVGDAVFEGNESFTVVLSNPSGGYGLADPLGAGTIIDDELAPTFSVDDVTAAEGTSGTADFVFTLSMSTASAFAASVTFTTSDGSATAPPDYLPAAGTLSFAPGETMATVTVTVEGDLDFEPEETFFVTLTNPVGATLGDPVGLGTIIDGDGVSVVEIPTLGGRGVVLLTLVLTLAAGLRLRRRREVEAAIS